MAKKKHGFLIGLLVVVGVLAVAVVVLLNLTPAQLGLADVKAVNGQSFAELGLAETKFFDIIKVSSSFVSDTKEEDVVKNAPSEEDKTSADTKAESFVGVEDSDGNLHYANLLKGTATLANTVTFSDREMAYMLDSALQEIYQEKTTEVSAEFVEVVQTFKDLSASVREITLSNAEEKAFSRVSASIGNMALKKSDDDLLLRAVVKLNIEKYVKEINIPFVKLSDTLYLTIVTRISVNDLGEVKQVEAVSVSINGQEEKISEIVLNALLKAMAKDLTAEDVSEYTARAFSYFCSQIGRIGADVNVLLPNYGVAGVKITENGATITFPVPLTSE